MRTLLPRRRAPWLVGILCSALAVAGGAFVTAQHSTVYAAPDCSQLPPIQPKPAGTLRFVTINTDGGKGSGWTNAERQAHLDSLSDLIACLDSDVVSLQEVHRETNYWPDIDMIDEIRAQLNQSIAPEHSWNRVFQPACKRFQNGPGIEDVGNAILTTDGSANAGGFVDVNGSTSPNGGGFDYNGETSDRAVGVMLPTKLRPPDSEGWPGGWGQPHARCYFNSDTAARRARMQRVATVAVTHDVLVVAVHLTPRAENDDLRREQLAALHDQIVEWINPLYNSVTGRGASRDAVVLGDFNEDECIFDDRCDQARNRAFAQIFSTGFLGTPWLNATEPVDDGSLDHIFTNGLSVSGAGKISPSFLNHDVFYADILH